MLTIENKITQVTEGTPERRAIITATVYPEGYGQNPDCKRYGGTAECSTDLEAAAIGEAVLEAVAAAWRDGYDPAIEPFEVRIIFR